MVFSFAKKESSASTASELADLKQRSELLDEACGVGLWQAILYNADANDPRSVWTWSGEFRRLLGFSDEHDFPNVVTSWSGRLHPDDVEPTFAAFGAHLTDRTGQARYDVTYRLRVRDGSYRWFRAMGGCRHAEDGVTIRACGSLVDIHEQRATELAFEQERAADAVAIGALAGALHALANGDLTHRIDVPFHAKAQGLKDDFNASLKGLDEAIGGVFQLVSTMRSGSHEISEASDEMSKRTEQQAASLEETAAALDEITATVRRTAEGAKQAADVTGAARRGAEQSLGVVGSAVEAMGEIEQSSRQISQIIGVIDEIAFQTNLLALNAGVEAARAGEAGRGFAVVASEVRALAQRSAEAAKEIKALITASSEQVGSGVKLVGETGEALRRIVSEVAQITDLVTEIAASAQEQATGLQQVNSAVNQMDQMTQQNAAMVEESTAASHALASDADALGELVARFRTHVAAAPLRMERTGHPVHQAQARIGAAAAGMARRAG
ncbi:MAG: PAS domain-containing methyl-accepting chemotaxis protein [Phenylobacterium sp.]|uniref:methyl-accepting chemotaxis protein n=1 Tax=Phenylobacterium sp. TaxID=1871053 RepID=UPI003918C57C